MATTSKSAAGECVARMAMAIAGPTPWVSISTWKVTRSSRWRKPYSVCASSRMWWCTWRNAGAPGSSSASVRGVTVTR